MCGVAGLSTNRLVHLSREEVNSLQSHARALTHAVRRARERALQRSARGGGNSPWAHEDHLAWFLAKGFATGSLMHEATPALLDGALRPSPSTQFEVAVL